MHGNRKQRCYCPDKIWNYHLDNTQPFVFNCCFLNVPFSILGSNRKFITYNIKKQSVLRSKVFRGVKCSLKQSVLRSKVFWGAECAEKQGVMRSKRFWVAKGVKEQGVLRSKSWLCKVLFEAKCVKLLRSKVFLLSKVFFEAKCASALKHPN